MVFTNVTIDGITHSMWLPVMDGANKAMKNHPYKYATKYNGEKTVDAATMFDINKTMMRCLVKNLAMFGLGLYIYAGEDLPEDEGEEQKKKKKSSKVQEDKITEKDIIVLRKELERTGLTEEKICNTFGIESFADMTTSQYASCLNKFKVTPDKKGA
jgi:hypothetical protein